MLSPEDGLMKMKISQPTIDPNVSNMYPAASDCVAPRGCGRDSMSHCAFLHLTMSVRVAEEALRVMLPVSLCAVPY